MTTWRIDYDAIDISVNEDIKDIDTKQLARIEALTEGIRDTIVSITEQREKILRSEEVEPALNDIAQALADLDLTLTTEAGVDLGKATVKLIPKGVTTDDVDVNLPFKQGESKLITDRTVGLLASERFDIDFDAKIREISSQDPELLGSSRVTIPMDDVVIKKMYTKWIGTQDEKFQRDWELSQQLAEGIEPKHVPKVLERGLDYVIAEKVEIDKKRAKELMKEPAEAFIKALKLGTDEVDAFVEAASKVKELEEIAKIADKYRDTVIIDDLLRGENLGFRGDDLVIVDPGSLLIGAEDISGVVEEYIPGDPGKYVEALRERLLARKQGKDAGEESSLLQEEQPVEELSTAFDKLRNILRRAVGEEKLTEIDEKDLDEVELVNPQMQSMARGYKALRAKLNKALREEKIKSDIEDFDAEQEADMVIRKKEPDLPPIPFYEEELQKQKDQLNEWKDFYDDFFQTADADITPSKDFFEATVSLANIRAKLTEIDEIFDMSSNIPNMIRVMSLHIVKEVLKNTDITLQYAPLDDEPGVDYSMEMKAAVKEVVEHWIEKVQDVIVEAVYA